MSSVDFRAKIGLANIEIRIQQVLLPLDTHVVPLSQEIVLKSTFYKTSTSLTGPEGDILKSRFISSCKIKYGRKGKKRTVCGSQVHLFITISN